MVSTDDLEITVLGSPFAASIPFMRSIETANDYSTTSDVIVEVLETYLKMGRKFDYCCFIYPTAPFVTPDMRKMAFFKLKESGADSIVPIVRFGSPILRSFRIDNGLIRMNWPDYINVRTQDISPSFYDSGQFYFLKVPKLFTDKTIPLIIPEIQAQDNYCEEDWKHAEIQYSILFDKNKG